MATVTWHDSAIDDVHEIAEQISEDSPRAAAEYVGKFDAASESLKLFPHSGRMVPEHARPEFRELIVRPYRLI